MKTISFRDLQRVSWLAKYSEENLLDIKRDKLVVKVLSQIGFNCTKALQYSYAYHRDLTGFINFGYMVSGEIDLSRSFLTSKLADLTDILVASAHTDISLTVTLAELAGKFTKYGITGSVPNEKGIYSDQWNPNWKEVEEKINQATLMIAKIRGPAYNEVGSPKTVEEYAYFYKTVLQKTYAPRANLK